MHVLPYGEVNLDMTSRLNLAQPATVTLAASHGGLYQLATRRATYFTYFAIAVVALWQGAQLVPALLHGFVLLALPALAVLLAAVICLGCGIALLILPSRVGGRPSEAADGPPAAPSAETRETYV